MLFGQIISNLVLLNKYSRGLLVVTEKDKKNLVFCALTGFGYIYRSMTPKKKKKRQINMID